MELRHLRYFLAIAEERSFTRAAERLWVAQPGLSKQIRHLESELGVALFERHSRGVDLTEAGELFLERAREAIAAVEEAAATGRDTKAGLIGVVRLGLSAGTSWHLSPTLLDRFARTRERVELTVLEAYAGTLAHDLRDGRIDALIAPAGLDAADLRGLRRLDLGTEPWVVLVGRHHSLAAPGPVDAPALDGHEVAITGHRDALGYDEAVADVLDELGVTPLLTRAGPGPSLQASVARGDVVALTTAPATLHPDVMTRPLHPRRSLRFQLVWREETVSPALAEFIRLAGECLTQSPGASRRLMAVA
jgi:DNA-binding transcriptional LysR family regulator